MIRDRVRHTINIFTIIIITIIIIHLVGATLKRDRVRQCNIRMLKKRKVYYNMIKKKTLPDVILKGIDCGGL
jgi:hypothetical protein